MGEERVRRVDVRVIAATHRDLRQQVARGAFREDLLYRLQVVTLRIPPLRERPEDVPLLARFFLERFARRFGVPDAKLSDAVLARLTAHPWSGNVRELEHAIESLVALSPPGGELDSTQLMPGGAPGAGDPSTAPALGLKQRVEAYERGIVVEALRATGGHRTEAARSLGISRVTLHDKLRKYGLARGDDETE